MVPAQVSPLAHQGYTAPAAGANSATFWISLFVEVLLTGLLLITPWLGRAFPAAIHFGWRHLSDYTPRQRERIMPLLTRMAGLMSASFNAFSGFGIHQRIQAALVDPRHPPNLWWIAGALVSIGAIGYYYVQRFDEEAGEE